MHVTYVCKLQHKMHTNVKQGLDRLCKNDFNGIGEKQFGGLSCFAGLYRYKQICLKYIMSIF